MMRLLLAAALLAAAPALAQAPAGLPGNLPFQLPPGMSLSGFGAPTGPVKYAVAEVASKRFPEGDAAGPTFGAGATLTVIVEDGDRVRVSAGDQFGWVPKAMLSDSPVTPPPAPE